MKSSPPAKRRAAFFASVLATSLILAGCTNGANSGEEAEYDPGISDTEIVFGNSSPQSGVFANAGTTQRALESCFGHLNDAGGVKMADGKKRKLKLTILDDSYDPAKTLENTKKLVEQDGVFAMIATVGTGTNTAIAPYLNDMEVPQLYALSGASKFGANQKEWPWTIGWSPSYATEAAIYAKWLMKNHPNATVAILKQNDDYGNDYVNSFQKTIQGSGIKVVDQATYEPTDPTVDNQVTQLAQSKADFFFIVALSKQAVQALKKADELGWKPERIVAYPAASVPSTVEPAGVELSKGLISTNYHKDPSDPAWKNDPAMLDYLEKVKTANNVNSSEPTAVQGYAYCETIVKTLERSQPSRQGVMDAARSLDKVELALLLPGITMNTSATDPFPLESTYLTKFDGTRFAPQGDVWSLEGKTPVATK